VTVLGNEPPVADAGPALVTETGMPVTLDAGGSTDDFGIWRTYWDFDAPGGWDSAGAVLDGSEVILVGAGSWGTVTSSPPRTWHALPAIPSPAASGWPEHHQ